MDNCPQLGYYDQDGQYICPAGYQLVTQGGAMCCQPLTMQQGDDGVYGSLNLPEVVIRPGNVPLPPTESMPPKPKTWLQNNWYWVVMPVAVAALIWAWKKWGKKLKLKKK